MYWWQASVASARCSDTGGYKHRKLINNVSHNHFTNYEKDDHNGRYDGGYADS